MFLDEEEFEGCTHSCDCCAGCGHDEEGMEDFSPIITLNDENGNEVKFEIIDVVALEETGKEYLIVSEVKDEQKEDSEVEVDILEINQDGDEEVYDVVTDEKIAEKVFNIFQKQQEEEE